MLDGAIKQVETDAAYHESESKRHFDKAVAYRQELAGLMDAKARREAGAKKTAGERVAENLVVSDGGRYPDWPNSFSIGRAVTMEAPHMTANEALDLVRGSIAAAIDKVRADTIEECAKKAEGGTPCRIGTAEAIRALK